MFSTDFKHLGDRPTRVWQARLIVGIMNINDMLLAAGTSAMTLLADLQPRENLVRQGAEPGVVDAMHTLHAVYYGSTQSTRKQREARQFATINQHGFDRLHAIERAVKRLHDSSKSWALRRDLTRFSGGRHDFARHAREKLADYNADAPAEQPNSSFKVTTHTSTGQATMSMRGPAATIREFEHHIRTHAHDHDLAVADAALAAIENAANNGAPSTGANTTDAGSAGADRRPNYTIKVLCWLDDITAALNGEHPDALAVTTTGATITYTELLQKRIDPTAEYIALTPAHGAVALAHGTNPLTPPLNPLDAAANTINTRDQLRAEQARRAREGIPPIPPDAVEKALSRHGTAKDRALLEAQQTTCAGEGCSVPAAYCEINHNIPYSQGGLSVLSNMCLLCKHHNGKAGADEHYTTIGGIAHRILPDGRLVTNYHPLAALSPPRQKHQPLVPL